MKNGVLDKIKEVSYSLAKFDEESRVFKENNDKLAQLEIEESKLKSEVAKLEAKLTDPETDRLSIEQFLNLSKNAKRIVQSADERVKDIICRLIFLNFKVDEEKVTSHRLKEPFAILLKQRQLLSSRGGEN